MGIATALRNGKAMGALICVAVDCADGARVRLADPLGDRSIIDAATGRELQPIAAG